MPDRRFDPALMFMFDNTSYIIWPSTLPNKNHQNPSESGIKYQIPESGVKYQIPEISFPMPALTQYQDQIKKINCGGALVKLN